MHPEEEKVNKLIEEFNSILELAEKLNEVDTKNIDATSHVHGATNIFREDKRSDFTAKEKILSIMPENSGTYIKVPIVIEQE